MMLDSYHDCAKAMLSFSCSEFAPWLTMQRLLISDGKVVIVEDKRRNQWVEGE